MTAFSSALPYLAGEFGGNYSTDFSSPTDLSIIRRMLTALNAEGVSHSMYKLSPNNPDDGLSLYAWSSATTTRGEVFFTALAASPPTQF